MWGTAEKVQPLYRKLRWNEPLLPYYERHEDESVEEYNRTIALLTELYSIEDRGGDGETHYALWI